jgi:exosome complex component RRP40
MIINSFMVLTPWLALFMHFPGDPLDTQIYSQLSSVTIKGKPVETVRLGPGLANKMVSDGQGGQKTCIYSTSAGTLQYRQPNKFWLDAPNRRRYVPHPGDLVIGIVTTRTSEYLKVDINGAHPAILPLQTGFEAASRRARPNLQVGSLIYCRVSQADRYIEPEVLCVDADGKSNAFGELPVVKDDPVNGEFKGFMMFSCPVNQSWALQRPDCEVLSLLGKHLPFEIVIGANGRFAVDSPQFSLTLLIRDWILEGGKVDEQVVKAAAKKYTKSSSLKEEK